MCAVIGSFGLGGCEHNVDARLYGTPVSCCMVASVERRFPCTRQTGSIHRYGIVLPSPVTFFPACYLLSQFDKIVRPYTCTNHRPVTLL